MRKRYKGLLIAGGAAVVIAFWSAVSAGYIWLSRYGTYESHSESMAPTLRTGDQFLVRLDIYVEQNPIRGDVVVFLHPKADNEVYVKRLIGLPGDKIRMEDGRLFINGAVVPRRKLGTRAIETEFRQTLTFNEYEETLPNGRRYLVWERSDIEYRPPIDEIVVPAGKYFFLGDNRDNSLDSRYTNYIGYVPSRNLLHRPEFLYWSNDAGRILTAVQPPS